MNGKRARKLRKQIYGDTSLNEEKKQRDYRIVKTKDMFGMQTGVHYEAVGKRREYQLAKKRSK